MNYDLSDRLENFAANVILVYDKKLLTYAGDYLAKQLIRSSCSSALNYGEALGTLTDKDKLFKFKRIKRVFTEFKYSNKSWFITN
ncbi:four helix bundle protein [Psychroflexus sp. CAK57W]|uniref:four helix bundle protein n=1 Tax=Psychroflexus curvus TaxID=2873595 RepID=UPI001CCF76F9|nr:four helix bundle protein [Psychroflexus curvus]MBZ9785881.1 four helix bundle protein [Psychroflexus curvus]